LFAYLCGCNVVVFCLPIFCGCTVHYNHKDRQTKTTTLQPKQIGKQKTTTLQPQKIDKQKTTTLQPQKIDKQKATTVQLVYF
jgi:hypothetical protein